MVATCQYTLVKTHRIYHINSEPGCRLWALGGNGVSVWVRRLQEMQCSGGGVVRGEAGPVGGGAYGKSLYLPLNFAMNLILL